MARALYIHWPFCLAKCPYCDFNSHVRERVDMALWQHAMLADMRREAELAGGERLESIFFGGGTPSLMPPALVGALLAEAEKLWGFDPDIEITLEANPSSVEAANFAGVAAAGVNRVSLGLQSLDDGALKFLGRLHNADEGLKALETAQAAFDRVSFDLIYALPGQSPDQWEAMLRRALGFGTRHLSLYQLTIEPGTRFATDVRQQAFAPMDADHAAELYELTQDISVAAGLPAYEVSNHAVPGEESRHNLTYWRYQDYCGIGPGAHGRRGGFATQRHRKPENWLSAIEAAGHGISEERSLSASEQAAEALMMGLRLAEGVDTSALAGRFFLAKEAIIDAAAERKLASIGLVRRDGSRLHVTPAGMLVLDALIAELVPDGLVAA